eukprot:CAMPEP_0197918942 /NCGR_PEP_ID=MMETSP1439-20131203/86337_1 /TAXON_ID=66791 /ORGANISM="Gonyaulax spinifera, Strain CCMP409" /LENGTH=36 /DNA_ID= /DNA_START= /DNA_END= /DNA_ORIENTATION=
MAPPRRRGADLALTGFEPVLPRYDAAAQRIFAACGC